jgi:hypothetical protein
LREEEERNEIWVREVKMKNEIWEVLFRLKLLPLLVVLWEIHILVRG